MAIFISRINSRRSNFVMVALSFTDADYVSMLLLLLLVVAVGVMDG